MASYFVPLGRLTWWQTFEVVFGIPFLAAIALQLAMSLSLPRAFPTPALICVFENTSPAIDARHVAGPQSNHVRTERGSAR